MSGQYSRTEMLLGREAMEKIRSSRVAVFGIGGVGSGAVEALARTGIGTLDLIDGDRVELTNLNRQLIAMRENLGELKVDAAEKRVHSIDPDIEVNKHAIFFMPGNEGNINFSLFDYVLDAIDAVPGKLRIIERARDCEVPVISVMGCGWRMDPSKLAVSDISETREDPLARVMRRELRARGIEGLKVVWSSEPVMKPLQEESSVHGVTGSAAFVPPAAGMLAAAEIVRDLINSD